METQQNIIQSWVYAPLSFFSLILILHSSQVFLLNIFSTPSITTSLILWLESLLLGSLKPQSLAFDTTKDGENEAKFQQCPRVQVFFCLFIPEISAFIILGSCLHGKASSKPGNIM